jgi:FkbM family methyltransferase
MYKLLRNLRNSIIGVSLINAGVRRQIINFIRRKHYNEINIRIPVGEKLLCPVCFPESWVSFNEIFFHNEYEEAFKRIPMPKRWLDLGCHAGYFSLWVLWRYGKNRSQDAFSALLVDADLRAIEATREMIEINCLEDKFFLRHGVISQNPQERFRKKSYMDSSVIRDNNYDDGCVIVKTLEPEQILSILGPPYDLVKVDIEGGELDFLASYGVVINSSKYILMEWHSPDFSNTRKEKINQIMAEYKFDLVWESDEAVVDNSGKGEIVKVGVSLFINMSAA